MISSAALEVARAVRTPPAGDLARFVHMEYRDGNARWLLVSASAHGNGPRRTRRTRTRWTAAVRRAARTLASFML